jgi:hypothetical protein
MLIRRLFSYLREMLWVRCREMDLRILWPICKQKAGDLEKAREAFLLHMSIDPAYAGMTENELVAYVEKWLV